jgi:hypothetical protein
MDSLSLLEIPDSLIESLVSRHLAKRWQGGSITRWYLDFDYAMRLLDARIEFYHTGNTRSCWLGNRPIANCRAQKWAMKFYIQDHRVGSTWTPYGIQTAEPLAQALLSQEASK